MCSHLIKILFHELNTVILLYVRKLNKRRFSLMIRQVADVIAYHISDFSIVNKHLIKLGKQYDKNAR